ncbi:hypothetical protein BgiMline_027362 [Biomphalaria glabrata]|nr:uncharacterized protein LOC106057986 isoform X2 [Biomphalaria glabrata]XP_055861834.1 uncharacterized protein LOC106057986 isoform X2 [Biomphalaria glabrata]KAI8738259.1 hypothetical protein BgiMline_025162 [Biomphalaria glabrata]KAI8782436.1 hypothetical protein BgiBS90_015923 [Biomphalaria glabrata]
MGMWKERGLIYKVGFVGIVLGSLLFVVGFCAPAWAEFQFVWSDDHVESMGLWQTCSGSLSVCTMSVSNDNLGWLKAVRALECIAMFFALASCISGLYSNCILKAQMMPEFFNKNMETSAIVSVVFGCFGLIIFATQIQNYYPERIGQVSWGFILACVSNAFIGVSAFLMLISHKLHLMALQDQFVHRQLRGPYHPHLQISEYSIDSRSHIFIDSSEGFIDMVPPPYESVVSCISQNEIPPPPPYSELVKSST